MWGQLKQRLLRKLEREGCDPEVRPYLDLMNAIPELVTSSSCYGRILLIDLPDNTKKNAKFLFKSHQPVSAGRAWSALKECQGKSVWLKVDPLIVHVSCKDMATAEKLLKVKTKAGMKRGGVFAVAPERVQIELEGTYQMALPVKQGKTLLVSEDYFKLLVGEANAKMEKNEEMWGRFAEEFGEKFKVSK